MSVIAPYLSTIATGAGVIGTIMGANSQINAGRYEEDRLRMQGQMELIQADRNAKMLVASANEDLAVSQRKAIEARRQARVKQSRALAIAAASGAGTVDPTVIDIIGGYGEQGDLAAENELFQGRDSAEYKRYQARAGISNANVANDNYIFQGKIAKQAGRTNATATILSGASSLFTNYAMASDKGIGKTSEVATNDIGYDYGYSTQPTKPWWE